MSRNVVQVKYGPLEEAAARFEQLADEAGQSLKDVRARFDAVAGGGWRGPAADAHIALVEEELFPALERLVKAYERGAEVMRETHATMRQVDESGRSLFRRR